MPVSAKTFLFAGLLAMAPAPAFAQASQRCEGTLCDLYYGSSPEPKPNAPQAAPTPLTVPTTGGILGFFKGADATPAAPGAPASAPAQPAVQVGGGGLLGMARGEPAQRCTGTLCDLFYGGSPPETPAPQPVVATPGADDAAAPDPATRPGRTRRGRVDYGSADAAPVDYGNRQYEKPKCVAPPGDLWKCYR